MKFKLHTYDIQDLIIALISCDSKVITEEERERLDTLLTDLNNLCKDENDYTITLTVSE